MVDRQWGAHTDCLVWQWGGSAVHRAAKLGRTDVLALLLGAGASADGRDSVALLWWLSLIGWW